MGEPSSWIRTSGANHASTSRRSAANDRRITTPRPVTRTIDGKTISRSLESVSVDAQNGQAGPEFKPQTFNTEDLDIPTFLRNRK